MASGLATKYVESVSTPSWWTSRSSRWRSPSRRSRGERERRSDAGSPFVRDRSAGRLASPSWASSCWLRVTRKQRRSTTSSPGNSSGKWAATISSSRAKRRSPRETNRGSSGGISTQAKRSAPVSRSRSRTARLSESPETRGNGCAGSTASGVSTGPIRSSSSARSRFWSPRLRWFHRRMVIPAPARSARTPSMIVSRRVTSAWTTAGSNRPAATMKRSSICSANSASSRSRSTSGVRGAAARCRMRALSSSPLPGTAVGESPIDAPGPGCGRRPKPGQVVPRRCPLPSGLRGGRARSS